MAHEFTYVKAQCSAPLTDFLGFIQTERMIDNVVALLQGNATVDAVDKDGETALTKTRAEWFNDRARGEGRDRYWQRLFLFPQIFYGRFGEDALAIWQPILEASHD